MMKISSAVLATADGQPATDATENAVQASVVAAGYGR